MESFKTGLGKYEEDHFYLMCDMMIDNHYQPI